MACSKSLVIAIDEAAEEKMFSFAVEVVTGGKRKDHSV